MAEKNLTDGTLALERKKSRVITIEATEKPKNIKLRVAAYARVSTSSEDQLNSFAAQNRYYTSLISGKENWTLVDVYADEGITGTSAAKREDFQRMLADCRRGLIDHILCKSISRFARNTTECLELTRELKSIGVSVCFEEQNIDTMKVSGEILTSLFAAFAQAESESISKNLRWSYQRRMQAGEFITCKAAYGYKLKDGTLEISEPEASVVRNIFSLYLSGSGLDQIADLLAKSGIPTGNGKKVWNRAAVAYIIRNEKYIGDSMLQKKYSTGQIPYTQKINKGERTRYYLQNTHPPLIDQDTFKQANRLYRERSAQISGSVHVDNPLYRKIYCAHCGVTFKVKRHGTQLFWTCRNHDKNRDSCPVMQIPNSVITDAFLRLYYKLKNHGQPILERFIKNYLVVRSRRMLWSFDIIELNKKISELTSQNQLLATLKQQGLVDPDIFISQTNKLTEQLRAAKLEKERLMDTEQDENIAATRDLMDTLESGPEFLADFDAELFGELIDRIIVESNECLRFRLKNGVEFKESIERTVR